ncbi:glycosyltransferase family 2 protein [Calothrix sp. NIES-2098]|uniref:glycosyltransferase family 2 protein n=1 Tax=Calothrix sp. NIES-2098 TaxID=1954171 RepID=UPI000B614DC2|nr:putative glycosyl transferase [Calothrix sp. NIES-2098]
MLHQLENLFTKPKSRLTEPLPEFSTYLSFLNSLKLCVSLVAVVKVISHKSENMAGWQGLESLTCLSEDSQIYEIDVRYAWGSEIFKQNLVDHGWSESHLLDKHLKNEHPRHKVIIYLCKSSTGLAQNIFADLPNNFLIGQYWQSIKHCYLLLPLNHPFTLPITIETEVLQRSYATTYFNIEPSLIINSYSKNIKSNWFIQPHPQRKGEGGLRTKGLFKKSTNNKPLISVITAVFNGEKYLEQTIQSVINQSYENVEYIIIDGGSSDKTIEIIKQYENELDYWVSEPDLGISDAFNKGLNLAKGDFINFINSDDLFFSALYFSCLHKLKYRDFYYSKIFFDKEGLTISRALPKSFLLRFKFNVAHETVICSKELLKNNHFPNSLKYAMDFPVLYKAIKNSKNIEFVNMVSVYMRRTGISVQNSMNAQNEVINVLREEKDYIAYIYQVIKAILVKALK